MYKKSVYRNQIDHCTEYVLQGQPKQWLQLGRKALDAKDNKKATMLLNMSLYLSDSSTEQAILPQVHHALAEVHFNLNEHERSIDSGKECFKLRPIKSEVFAYVFSFSLRSKSLIILFIVMTSTRTMMIITMTTMTTLMMTIMTAIYHCKEFFIMNHSN